MNSRQAVAQIKATDMTPKEQEILEVASRYFLGHGYRGTSINAMARDSGISKESIYRYFSSKKDLFEAVVAKGLAEYKQRLEFLEVETGSATLKETLVAAAESILSLLNDADMLALRRLIFHEAETTPEIGAYYYEIGPRAAYAYLEKIFRNNRHCSTFPPAKLAHYFVALVVHYPLLRRQCGVATELSQRKIRAHAAEVTSDFLTAYFDQGHSRE
jgi:TetR/AcrR family transcriptional repressor of mexJK operon